jgi:site-specific DNA-cytosine methylase
MLKSLILKFTLVTGLQWAPKALLICPDFHVPDWRSKLYLIMSKRKQPDSNDDKSAEVPPGRKSSRPRKEVVYTEENIETPVATVPRTIKGSGGGSTVTLYDTSGSIPKKNQHGQLVFTDHPEFRPNLTPKESASFFLE